MRNTHPALFSANENRNRPKARTNVTNFRANATLPDKKSQCPLRMPGSFFVLYTGEVPDSRAKPPARTNQTDETRRTPPPAKTETDSRHRPHSDTGNFRLPAAPRDEIRHLRNPPDASPADPKAPSAPSSCEPDHNPCMGSRPPYECPAKRHSKNFIEKR